MRLTKTTQAAGNTYIVLRSETNDDYITVTLPGAYEVEINAQGTALSVRPRKWASEEQTTP